eukprot:CAMPEP_0119340334 /NCGR_PEP_ID=MMETSP1333-20130426/100140_1 /TAXON_ID=418940 /ORGANISM="Scyphosphaera apsteinii, Strain RCC1455" /LENGTH=96 /DNA_ID=CAMNT_0007352067 /DNA_START=77 /DNA_END=367 /DNA_ORIENTATION=-
MSARARTPSHHPSRHGALPINPANPPTMAQLQHHQPPPYSPTGQQTIPPTHLGSAANVEWQPRPCMTTPTNSAHHLAHEPTTTPPSSWDRGVVRRK